MIHKIFDPLARRWGWVAACLRVQDRFAEVNGGYLASAVTLSAFLSLFPLLLVTLAVVGFVANQDVTVASDIINKLGLSGEGANTVVEAIETAREHRGSASVVGLVGLLWSGLGLIASLSFAFDSVWQVKSRGIKDKLFGLAWLAGASLIILASVALTTALNFLPGPATPFAVLVGLALDVVLFWWTLRVLVNNKLPWRAHMPGALVGGVGLELLKLIGAVYVPRAVASSSALYGSIVTVFAILAWLLFFGRLVVYAAVTNVVQWEEEHGTVTVELEVPNLPDQVPVTSTRSGQAETTEDNQASERQ